MILTPTPTKINGADQPAGTLTDADRLKLALTSIRVKRRMGIRPTHREVRRLAALFARTGGRQ